MKVCSLNLICNEFLGESAMFDFKNLISALFGRREQVGVHSLQSATQMMLELPRSQVLAAQAEIIKGLKQLNINQEIAVKERFRTIEYLDNKARALQQHLLDIYHGKIIDMDAPPKQVQHTIISFCVEMGNAYRQALKQYQASPARGIEPAQVQRFCLRGLMYFAEQAKWSYVRYLKVEPVIWRNVNRFYLYAERQGFERVELQAYTDQAATTLVREYAQALVLALSSPEKLLPKQVELVTQWLHCWADSIEIGREIRPHHHLFAINTDTHTAPRRLRRDMLGEQWRYGASARLVARAHEALDQLVHGESPEALGLPAASAEPVNIDLLRRLINLWSRDMPVPVRRHERRVARKPLSVVRGLDAVIGHLQRIKAGEQSDELLEWTLDNESDSGLGVQLQPRGQEALKVGEIIGVVSEQRPDALSIGVIRRIARRPDGGVEAGIETLSKAPLLVELSTLDTRDAIPVLYSPDSSGEQKDRFLLVPELAYAEADERKLAAQGRAYRIRLTGARERTPRAAVADFTVLGKLPA
jgi:hypothetical protein